MSFVRGGIVRGDDNLFYSKRSFFLPWGEKGHVIDVESESKDGQTRFGPGSSLESLDFRHDRELPSRRRVRNCRTTTKNHVQNSGLDQRIPWTRGCINYPYFL
jgi:hypothetical protein